MTTEQSRIERRMADLGWAVGANLVSAAVLALVARAGGVALDPRIVAAAAIVLGVASLLWVRFASPDIIWRGHYVTIYFVGLASLTMGVAWAFVVGTTARWRWYDFLLPVLLIAYAFGLAVFGLATRWTDGRTRTTAEWVRRLRR